MSAVPNGFLFIGYTIVGACAGAAATTAMFIHNRPPPPGIELDTPPPPGAAPPGFGARLPPPKAIATSPLATASNSGPPATPFTPIPNPASPVNPAGLFDYGFPGPVADLAARQALISSFDRRTRNPHWVAEHITPASLAQRDGDRKNSTFLEDTGIPEKFQAKLKDYFRSGYDRGHQVPAADCKWSQKAMDETFYLSNMCPQVGDGFNRDYWAHFEDFCRRLTTRYPSVRVVTGPLYLPKKDPADNKWYVKYEMIGSPPNVAVPTHFYKVIYAEEQEGNPKGKVALGAFVLPNAVIPNDKPLSDFEVPLDAVERASGLEFANKLPVTRRKRLCAEMSCAMVIKDYAERQKAFAKK